MLDKWQIGKLETPLKAWAPLQQCNNVVVAAVQEAVTEPLFPLYYFTLSRLLYIVTYHAFTFPLITCYYSITCHLTQLQQLLTDPLLLLVFNHSHVTQPFPWHLPYLYPSLPHYSSSPEHSILALIDLPY